MKEYTPETTIYSKFEYKNGTKPVSANHFIV